MANDFFKQEEVQEEPKAPEKIKLGDAEYSESELNDLVGLGKLAKEAETKYNTKLDRVWPEYGKSQSKVKELEAQLEELKTKKVESQQTDLTPDAISQAREAAKKIGIVTEDRFDDYLDSRFRTRYLQERSAEKMVESCQGFEEKIDGKDGRPAFKTEEILNHMANTGFRDPQKAYKDLYEKEIDVWKEKQYESMKKPGFPTQEESFVAKQPTTQKITDANLRAALEESLYGKRG
jgi:hypothetical protein